MRLFTLTLTLLSAVVFAQPFKAAFDLPPILTRFQDARHTTKQPSAISHYFNWAI